MCAKKIKTAAQTDTDGQTDSRRAERRDERQTRAGGWEDERVEEERVVDWLER